MRSDDNGPRCKGCVFGTQHYLSDHPTIYRDIAKFNAGVARARMEYDEFPLLHGRDRTRKRWGQRRECPRCEDLHKSKRHELCWRCRPARTTTKETSK